MSGHERSFASLLGEGGRIVVPRIQRDYAQGREDQEEVRQSIASALAAALVAPPGSRPLDLDFIYGTVSADGTLEPLDGQQRLTTLFLLHWLVAVREGRYADFLMLACDGSARSRFSYETRRSATDFFDDLVAKTGKTPPPSPGAIRPWLEEQPWFQRAWASDPTVLGCLNMLTALEGALGPASGGWDRLLDEERRPIVLHVLPLAHFGLSDDLYIKMNARGKPLTSFEIFKPRLTALVEQLFGQEVLPGSEPPQRWSRELADRFDGAYTMLLWTWLRGAGSQSDPSRLDPCFLHLIRAVALFEVVEGSPDAPISDLSRRVGVLLAAPAPTLADLAEAGCLTRSFVRRLVRSFDALIRTQDRRGALFGGARYVDEVDLLARVVEPDPERREDGLTHRFVVEWAAYLGFLLDGDADRGDLLDVQRFHEWMRVASNLAVNSPLADATELARALRGLLVLRPAAIAGTLLQRLSTDDAQSGFSRQQRREEGLKARLMLRDPAWRTPIERIEDNPDLEGHLGFVLEWAGISAAGAEHGGATWSDEEDRDLRDALLEWWARYQAVFPPEQGWKSRPGRDDWLWERALLCGGDYSRPNRLVKRLLHRSPPSEWKALLRDETPGHEGRLRRDVVRQALESVKPSAVEDSLRQVISEGPEPSAPAWRRRLIAEPRLLERSREGWIRFDDGTVFVLAKRSRGSDHDDLHLRWLELRLAGSEQLSPFTRIAHHKSTGRADPPRLRLNGKQLRLDARNEWGQIRMELRGRRLAGLDLPQPWELSGTNRWSRTASPEESEDVLLALAGWLRSAEASPV